MVFEKQGQAGRRGRRPLHIVLKVSLGSTLWPTRMFHVKRRRPKLRIIRVPVKRECSFPPLGPCSRRGIAIPGPKWPSNRAAPFLRLALSATGGASPGNSPHRTRFAGLRRGPRYWFRYRRCRASGGTHRDYPASLVGSCAVPAWPAGPPSVPCRRTILAVVAAHSTF